MRKGLGLFLFAAAFFLFEVEEVQATEDKAGASVLLLLMSNEQSLETLQYSLKNELQLALDNCRIETRPHWEFSATALADRIKEIRPIAEEHEADTTIWIELSDTEVVTLHMVLLGPGRSTVRSLEAQRGVDTGAELAIAVRELLEDLSIQSPEQPDPAKALLQAPTESSTHAPPDWFMSLLFQYRGGVVGHEGPSDWLSGKLAVERWTPHDFYFRVSFAPIFSVPRSVRDGDFSIWGLEPGLGVGVDWRMGDVLVGLFLDANVSWHKADSALGEGPRQTDTWWNISAFFGADLRYRISDRFMLVVRPSAGSYLQHKYFIRQSDESIVFTTPYLEWGVCVGLAYGVG